MGTWKIITFEEAVKKGLVPKSYADLLDLQMAADYLGIELITVQIQAGNGQLKACRTRKDARPLHTTKKWCDEYRAETLGKPGLKKGQRRGPSKTKKEPKDD